MDAVVRTAAPLDAVAISAIHSEAVEERVATFRTEPVSAQEVEGWLEQGDVWFLVAESDRQVVGFASVGRYSDFPPYAGVGEYAIYIARAARRQGIGALLLESLCAEADSRGLHKLVGKLFTTNQPSILLARRCGFRDVGVHVRHARLEGEWKDVMIVERTLGSPGG